MTDYISEADAHFYFESYGSEEELTAEAASARETTTLNAQWQEITDPVSAFLEDGGQYNNKYYCLVNWCVTFNNKWVHCRN